MIRFIAAVRSTLIVTAWLLGGPVLLFAVAGSPIPPRRPSAVQVETWLDDPLNPLYKEETARTLAWIVWALIAIAICAVLAHHLRPSRWTKIIGHLPPPMQSLTAAVLGTAAVTAPISNLAVSPEAVSTHITDTHQLDMQQPVTLTAYSADRANTTLFSDASEPGYGTLRAELANRHPGVPDAVPADAAAVHLSPGRSPLKGTVHRETSLLAATTNSRYPFNGASEALQCSPAARPQPTMPYHAATRYRVVKGDSLWRIAETKLDDPYRWREIYTLNRDHMQADGDALSDPDEIHTGWVLALPATHATAAHPPTNTPAPASTSTPPHTGGPQARAEDPYPAPHASTPTPSAVTTTPASAATTPAPSTPPVIGSPSAIASPPGSAPTTSSPARQEPPAAGSVASDSDDRTGGDRDRAGISLPSQGWVSLGLASLITAVASLLRLQQRRHARLGWPIPTGIAAQPTSVPEHLAAIAAAGGGHTLAVDEQQPPWPASTAVAAPVGLDADGNEVSLFDLPGLALAGDGAEMAARAVVAAVLATGTTSPALLRPMVVTTTETLAQLLPDGTASAGLDPDGITFDGERLVILNDTAAAVTHAEEEMIVRRRLLDTFDLDTITALNKRTDHAEMQPPYVLLIEADPRHAARLHAVSAHRAALDLHPVILGALDGISSIQVTGDGTTSGKADAGLVRMSTLGADDLAAILAMLTHTAARPEPGHDIDPTPAEVLVPHETTDTVPAQPSGLPAQVRLRVLGPVLVETASGPVATGMRSGSYLVLASLAVHPGGRTLNQLSADLHPDTDPSTAGKRIRTDISTTRRVLRRTSGLNEPKFIVYDPANSRYRLDAELITVDLWQMLTAIKAANTADDDTTALAALREAARLYAGDFADGHDQTWITDHATSYRHQILAVYARIAELLEADHPDQAIDALEHALALDPVNEELYQRIIRIHGRAGHPDQVRRTLRLLEKRMADLGDAEPSEATRRIAERQLRPAITSGARS